MGGESALEMVCGQMEILTSLRLSLSPGDNVSGDEHMPSSGTLGHSPSMESQGGKWMQVLSCGGKSDVRQSPSDWRKGYLREVDRSIGHAGCIQIDSAPYRTGHDGVKARAAMDKGSRGGLAALA